MYLYLSLTGRTYYAAVLIRTPRRSVSEREGDN